MRIRGTTVFATLCLAASVLGCEGKISARGGDFPTPTPDGAVIPADAMVVDPGDPGLPVSIPPTSRVPRLSHAQWESTVRDLLLLPERSGLSSMFSPDTQNSTFGNAGDTLRIDQTLWVDYQTAAETLARRIATDAAATGRLMPAGAPSDAAGRARAWVTQMGLRAYRRPLSEEEISAHLNLFNNGAMLLGGGEAFAAGVEVTLRLFLQSPHFLFRVESSSEGEGGVVPLNDYELATRLSYALWDTMPDDALFAAAAAGALTSDEGLTTQIERMLADPRAREAVNRFHRLLYELDSVTDVRRNTASFPLWNDRMPQAMLRESETFLDHVVWDERRGLTTLLTADYSFVNADVASVYGLSGSYGTDFTRATLGEGRSGILTQPAFLAAKSYASDPDPIHRGVFVNLRVLCANLPNPPSNVAALPAAMMGTTNRQRVERHTGVGTCGASCHATLINPVGFAFENYNPIGAIRTTDDGRALDLTGTYLLDSEEVSFDGAVQLAGMISRSQQAHACYVRYWMENLLGRGPQALDRPVINAIGTRSRTMDLPVLDLVRTIVRSRTFRARSAAVEGGT